MFLGLKIPISDLVVPGQTTSRRASKLESGAKLKEGSIGWMDRESSSSSQIFKVVDQLMSYQITNSRNI